MILVYLDWHVCVSRGRKTNQYLLWWEYVGVHLEMLLPQSASKFMWMILWLFLGKCSILHEPTIAVFRYWYLGPLKSYAAHWFRTLRVGIHVSLSSVSKIETNPETAALHVALPQEWPLVRDISISHLAPTLRPPDLPFEKPPRPSLLFRIARRLKNYWNPPIEGSMSWYWKIASRSNVSFCMYLTFLCVLLVSLRASKSGRARAVEGGAVINIRIVGSNT